MNDFFRSLAQGAEEICQHGPALIFENAAHERGAEGEAFHKKVQHAATGAHRLIARAVENARNTGVNDRARAHGAGLKRHIERAAVEPPRLQRFVCLRDGLHLCVRRSALLFLAPVAAAADDLTVLDDDAADGHLALRCGFPRKKKRFTHIVFVLHGRLLV